MDHLSLIYKVLSDEATAQEKEELERWLRESPENREEFEDLKLIWEYTPSEADNLVANDAVFEKIRLRAKAHLKRKQHIRTALSAVLLVLAALLSIYLLQRTWLASLEPVEFKGQEMRSVIKVLERKYNIEINVDNPAILDCRYTAVLLRVDDAREVLRSIEHSLKVKFIGRGENTYNLVGEGCATNQAGSVNTEK